MKPRIAIPVPHSTNLEYSEQTFPQYEAAVESAGGEPVRVLLDQAEAAIQELLRTCDGVLLPGSRADLDPQKYKSERQPETAPADPARETADALLLQDAFAMRKPILGICYGLQSLNVHCHGTLNQHIESEINHAPGPVKHAHNVVVEEGTWLSTIVGGKQTAVNSSHHQGAQTVGQGLRISARCAEDGVIEALEGVSPDHFVLAVQWHPERSVDEEVSRGIFRALIEAAARLERR